MTYNIDLSKYLTPHKEQYSEREIDRTSGLYLDYFSDCKSILDVGSGVGIAVKYLNELGKEAIGITYNQMEVNEAQKRGTPIFLGEMHKINYPDESFDAVLCWDCLEHSIAPFIALSEIKRVVKKKGKILIFIPELTWLDNPDHFYQLNRQQMKHLINRVGGLMVEEVITRIDEDGIYKLRKI